MVPVESMFMDRRPDILLALEDRSERTYLEELISRVYDVVTVDTPESLVAQCRQRQPDIVLLAAEFGGEHRGIELCYELKTDVATRHLSVVLLCRRDQPLSLEGRPDELVLRPIHEAELALRISNVWRLRCYAHELLQDSPLDPLTSVFSRAHLLERLKHELLRADRYGRSLSVALIDLDGFSRINDEQGARQGDRLLHEVARGLVSRVRGVDLVARMDDDEFAVVLPETSLKVAQPVAERLRTMISEIAFGGDSENGPQHFQVTASLGVVGVPHPEFKEVPDLLRCAREALANARSAGGDRVVMY